MGGDGSAGTCPPPRLATTVSAGPVDTCVVPSRQAKALLSGTWGFVASRQLATFGAAQCCRAQNTGQIHACGKVDNRRRGLAPNSSPIPFVSTILQQGRQRLRPGLGPLSGPVVRSGLQARGACRDKSPTVTMITSERAPRRCSCTCPSKKGLRTERREHIVLRDSVGWLRLPTFTTRHISPLHAQPP